jgi:hypothetical protein
MPLNETPRQRSDEIRAREVGNCHHKARHGQDNAALKAAPCQQA